VREVDVSKTVSEMIELLKVSMSKHARLETSLAAGLPAVRADAAQIRQIVMNLVTNASEAVGDRDGVIRLATTFVNADPDRGYVQLEVSDTGCGMPPEMHARVFNPYFTTKSAGHGLGLAIVDGLVRSLDGKIHLASEPGKGARFQVLLPCEVRTAIPVNPMSSPEDAAPFSGLATVLVIEDEGTLRQAAVKVLRKSGFQVLEAADGLAAIDVLRASASRIDLILLDMTFPGSSCHEVVAEYVQARPNGKVILTSAYSEEMARATINVPQIRGFVRKPFQVADLLRTLRSTLSS
jgi:CheY-like chemotaxis protein/anti-sigma regulatory factor (Ser/Thr protein kinase)